MPDFFFFFFFVWYYFDYYFSASCKRFRAWIQLFCKIQTTQRDTRPPSSGLSKVRICKKQDSLISFVSPWNFKHKLPISQASDRRSPPREPQPPPPHPTPPTGTLPPPDCWWDVLTVDRSLSFTPDATGLVFHKVSSVWCIRSWSYLKPTSRFANMLDLVV